MYLNEAKRIVRELVETKSFLNDKSALTQNLLLRKLVQFKRTSCIYSSTISDIVEPM
jgi:hypothetical protein